MKESRVTLMYSIDRGEKPMVVHSTAKKTHYQIDFGPLVHT